VFLLFQARQVLREAAPSPVMPDASPSITESSNAGSESTPSTSEASTSEAALTLEERVARAKQLLAERQAQKAKEEEEVRLVLLSSVSLSCRCSNGRALPFSPR
jgi:hypothetical protein